MTTRRREIPFKPRDVYALQRKITPDEFRKMVADGQQLVILDDMVLDISKFMRLHPGG